MATAVLMKRLPDIPKPGEVMISVNLGRVEKVDQFLALASAYGFDPELRWLRMKDSTEIHALLVHAQHGSASVPREGYRPYLDQLEEWGIDYSAVRFVSGISVPQVPTPNSGS